MKITQDVLTKWYLNDLTLPDAHHGRDTPKVRNIAAWEAITSFVKQGSAVPTINPYSGDVWVWSDTHFGHNNIIKYTAPMRPFASKEEMNAAMIANYQAVVKPEDIVIFGGDVCFGSVNAMNDILRSLPGYKIQIVGNHDMHRDGTLYELDFDERHLCLPVSIAEPDGFEYQLLFTHYPMDNVPHHCVNVHGHIHQWTANPWNINICVEHTGSAPRNLRDVCAQARKHLEQK